MSATCDAGSDASLKKLPVVASAVTERVTASGLVGKDDLKFVMPAGFDPKTFRGPFLTVLAFAVYVFVPIGILEFYFRAQCAKAPRTQWLMTAGLAVTTILTAGGIVAVSAILWIPAMRIR